MSWVIENLVTEEINKLDDILCKSYPSCLFVLYAQKPEYVDRGNLSPTFKFEVVLEAWNKAERKWTTVFQTKRISVDKPEDVVKNLIPRLEEIELGACHFNFIHRHCMHY